MKRNSAAHGATLNTASPTGWHFRGETSCKLHSTNSTQPPELYQLSSGVFEFYKHSAKASSIFEFSSSCNLENNRLDEGEITWKKGLDKPTHEYYFGRFKPQSFCWLISDSYFISLNDSTGPVSFYSETQTSSMFVVGSYLHGALSGRASIITTDLTETSFYEGNMLNGFKHGKGKELNIKKTHQPVKQCLLEGNWVKGLKEGLFVLTFYNKKGYLNYKEDNLVGLNKMVWNNGRMEYLQTILSPTDNQQQRFKLEVTIDGVVGFAINEREVETAEFFVQLYERHLSDFLLVLVKQLPMARLKACCEQLIASNHDWAPWVLFANEHTFLSEPSRLPYLETVDEKRLLNLFENIWKHLKPILNKESRLLITVRGMLQALNSKLCEKEIMNNLVKVFPNIHYYQHQNAKKKTSAIRDYQQAVKEKYLSPVLQRIELIYELMKEKEDFQAIHEQMKAFRQAPSQLEHDHQLKAAQDVAVISLKPLTKKNIKQGQQDRQKLANVESREADMREALVEEYTTGIKKIKSAESVPMKYLFFKSGYIQPGVASPALDNMRWSLND